MDDVREQSVGQSEDPFVGLEVVDIKGGRKQRCKVCGDFITRAFVLSHAKSQHPAAFFEYLSTGSVR